MKIVITPKTSNGEVGLLMYINDNQELTRLCKGRGFITNMGQIKVILRKWGINYSTYMGTKRITEKFSSQDGSINPPCLTVDLFEGQCDIATRDKFVKDLFKVFKKCYAIDEHDLEVDV